MYVAFQLCNQCKFVKYLQAIAIFCWKLENERFKLFFTRSGYFLYPNARLFLFSAPKITNIWKKWHTYELVFQFPNCSDSLWNRILFYLFLEVSQMKWKSIATFLGVSPHGSKGNFNLCLKGLFGPWKFSQANPKVKLDHLLNLFEEHRKKGEIEAIFLK